MSSGLIFFVSLIALGILGLWYSPWCRSLREARSKNEHQLFERFFKKSLGAIIQSEEDYKALAENRRGELGALLTKAPTLAAQVAACKKGLDEAWGETKRLREGIDEALRVLHESDEGRWKRVFSFLDRSFAESNSRGIGSTEPGILAMVAENDRIARQFIIDKHVRPQSGTDNRDLEALLDEYLCECDEDIKLDVSLRVDMCIQAANNQRLHIDLLEPYVVLARVYRGIFFVGILGDQGSALERKADLEKLKEVARSASVILAGKAVAHFMPDAEDLVTMIDLIILYKSNVRNKQLATTDDVLRYLEDLSTVIDEWDRRARRIRLALMTTLGILNPR